MIFEPLAIAGACLISVERRADDRGWFARAWCEQEFAQHGLDPRIAHVNVSHNVLRGTVRGMHFQLPPFAEAKTVSCTRGAIFDVVVDLREQSPTYLRWQGYELSAENRNMLHIPKGCAHGFQALTNDTELLYFMSEVYSPVHSRGVQFDDPAIGIEWPLPVTNVSPADRNWPAIATMSQPLSS